MMNDFVRCISSSSSLGFVPLRLCGLWICAVYRFLSHDSKVDEAYVDTSSSMESSNRWIRALEIEQVNKCESRPKKLKSLKLELRKVLI